MRHGLRLVVCRGDRLDPESIGEGKARLPLRGCILLFELLQNVRKEALVLHKLCLRRDLSQGGMVDDLLDHIRVSAGFDGRLAREVE